MSDRCPTCRSDDPAMDNYATPTGWQQWQRAGAISVCPDPFHRPDTEGEQE